jgi:hypothetical protein
MIACGGYQTTRTEPTTVRSNLHGHWVVKWALWVSALRFLSKVCVSISCLSDTSSQPLWASFVSVVTIELLSWYAAGESSLLRESCVA